MESYVDRKYRLYLFSSCLVKPAFVGTPNCAKWRLECPLCGFAGAHLIWLPGRNTFKFLCSAKSAKSCATHAEFPVLLKMWNLSLYRAYLQEREEEGTAGAGFNVPLASQVLPQRRSSGRLGQEPASPWAALRAMTATPGKCIRIPCEKICKCITLAYVFRRFWWVSLSRVIVTAGRFLLRSLFVAPSH